jgi:NitT/TauT family transport system substrate-binding protein
MKKIISLLLAVLMLACMFTGCANEETEAVETPEVTEEPTTIRVGAMTGPTSMGMVKLMDESDNGESANKYEFTLQSEATAFVPALTKGEIDIAAVPANLASVIYNNTDGGIKVLSVCATGVLYIVERGDSIKSFADLAGKNIYATGEGATPEYSLRYLLKANGIDGDNAPTIQWCADTTEALSYISQDENAIAMLPQPFVTAAQSKVSDLKVALSLNDEWQKVNDGASMATGVVVVRTEFAEKYPQQLATFMEEYAASVKFVNENNDQASELIGNYEIVKAPIALKALPYCNICCLTGDELKECLNAYLSALYEMNPQSVGGSLLDDGLYYAS